MRQLTPIALLLLLFSVSPAMSSQPATEAGEAADAGEDIENARTPGNILELLPGDEKDWPKDFWLMLDGVGGEELYMGWAVERSGETIVVTMRMGDAGSDMHAELTYSDKGRLVSMQSRRVRSSGAGRTVAGQVLDGHLKITSIRTYPDDFKREPRTTVSQIPLEEIESAILLELAPVVVGYHARNGSLGYAAPLMVLMEGHNVRLDLAVEDVGTEPIEIDGEQRTSHILLINVGEPDDGDAPSHESFKMTARFLDNGEFVSLKLEHEEVGFDVKRATVDQVAERFNKDKADLLGE